MTTMTRNFPRIPARQRGAALVVGLILLAVLTLLAVSGMNTASTELIMAGNEQYRQQAFQASATGLERALITLPTLSQTPAPQPGTKTAVPGTTTDFYLTSSQYMGDDLDLPGFSSGKFVGLHYQITSTGMSVRDAQVEQVQGAFVIQSAGGNPDYSSIVPTTSTSPPAN
jgi:type IV pilus assembly protein PilX